MFFAAPNLVSKSVSPCVPWEFKGIVPEEVKGKEAKKKRTSWMCKPGTVHQAYTAIEGLNPNERVTEAKGTEEGNPPLKLHAAVVDIDQPLTEEELTLGIGRLGKFVPNYIERTLSGNARLIFLFEKPVAVPSSRFAKEFLTLLLERTKLDAAGAGFDKPAFTDVTRLYTNSGTWATVEPEARMSAEFLQGLVVETAGRHLWKRDRGAIEIPLPEVLKELEKKWPLHNWPGDFVEGSQGPSFFIDGSASDKSAVVKSTGMFTFSAHAPKPFYSWADLVGIQFVKEYASKMMGKAVEGIYHDGVNYFRKIGFDQYRAFGKEDVCLHLRVARGLSSGKNGNEPSEVETALHFLQEWQAIDGAASFVFQPPGLIRRSNGLFLNTHTKKVLAPSAEGGVWGELGGFPWLSTYFDGLFSSKEQLPFFISWLSRFYRGAYELNLENGQNIFILGFPGVGKTFFSQGILPRLMGGAMDAEAYLLGETGFNDELFSVGAWTVDDNSATVTAESHRKFSQMIKKMAAGVNFQSHGKYLRPVQVAWSGRVVITANDDEESARIVPDLSISILDKLMLFRTCKTPHVEFPVRSELVAILDRELPAFARFLLNFEAPAQCRGSSRFGVRAYHEPSLLQTAEQSSRTAGFHEVIDDFLQSFFLESKADYWEGSSWQLVKALHQSDLTVASALRNISADLVSRNLMSLKAKGFEIEAKSERGTRIWRINRPKK